jgi:Trypsin
MTATRSSIHRRAIYVLILGIVAVSDASTAAADATISMRRRVQRELMTSLSLLEHNTAAKSRSAANSKQGLPTSTARIDDGRPIATGESFNNVVTGQFGCGGSLIHEDIVLTSADCLEAFSSSGRTVSIFDLTDNNVKTIIDVQSVLPSPVFNDGETLNLDIMLVKLATPSTAPLVNLNLDGSIAVAENDALTVVGLANSDDFNGRNESNIVVNDQSALSDAFCDAFAEEDFCPGNPGIGLVFFEPNSQICARTFCEWLL